MKQSTNYIANHHKNHFDAFCTRQKQNCLLQGVCGVFLLHLVWTDVKPSVKHNGESSETFTSLCYCIPILDSSAHWDSLIVLPNSGRPSDSVWIIHDDNKFAENRSFVGSIGWWKGNASWQREIKRLREASSDKRCPECLALWSLNSQWKLRKWGNACKMYVCERHDQNFVRSEAIIYFCYMFLCYLVLHWGKMRQNIMNFKTAEDYAVSFELGLSAIEKACFFSMTIDESVYGRSQCGTFRQLMMINQSLKIHTSWRRKKCRSR